MKSISIKVQAMIRQHLKQWGLFNRFERAKVNSFTGGIDILSDDVFIVSYPKSGNTWVRFLLGNYLTDCRVDFTNSHLIVPDIHFNPEQCALLKYRPRFIKSHFSYTEQYPNVVYILRDGRDVTVSYFFYLKKIGRLASDVSFENYIRDYTLYGDDMFGDWAQHVRSWTRVASEGKLLCIKYEDILSDTAKQLERILSFAGVKPDHDIIDRAVYSSSFSQMQKMETIQHDACPTLSHVKNKEIKFVREGRSGQWRDYFSHEALELFMKRNEDVLKAWGYD